jgi:hypothetical protein
MPLLFLTSHLLPSLSLSLSQSFSRTIHFSGISLNQLQLGWESKRKGMFGVRAMETGPQTSLHHSPLNHHLQKEIASCLVI